MSATMEEAPAGEIGEICLHGPAVMLGYLEMPEETAETLKVHPDGKLWLHTGDLGYIDEDGAFELVGTVPAAGARRDATAGVRK